jgi:transposase
VFEGNTGDPKTLPNQIKKLKERFHLDRVVLVGDRGMITEARIRDDLAPAHLDWVTALRGPAIETLCAARVIQPSLFDQRGVAEVSHPDYPGERLIACFNPFTQEQRQRQRTELLEATEEELRKVHRACIRRLKSVTQKPVIPSGQTQAKPAPLPPEPFERASFTLLPWRRFARSA